MKDAGHSLVSRVRLEIIIKVISGISVASLFGANFTCVVVVPSLVSRREDSVHHVHVKSEKEKKGKGKRKGFVSK
jgi:hypothetical protein